MTTLATLWHTNGPVLWTDGASERLLHLCRIRIPLEEIIAEFDSGLTAPLNEVRKRRNDSEEWHDAFNYLSREDWSIRRPSQRLRKRRYDSLSQRMSVPKYNILLASQIRSDAMQILYACPELRFTALIFKDSGPTRSRESVMRDIPATHFRISGLAAAVGEHVYYNPPWQLRKPTSMQLYDEKVKKAILGNIDYLATCLVGGKVAGTKFAEQTLDETLDNGIDMLEPEVAMDTQLVRDRSYENRKDVLPNHSGRASDKVKHQVQQRRENVTLVLQSLRNSPLATVVLDYLTRFAEAVHETGSPVERSLVSTPSTVNIFYE